MAVRHLLARPLGLAVLAVVAQDQTAEQERQAQQILAVVAAQELLSLQTIMQAQQAAPVS